MVNAKVSFLQAIPTTLQEDRSDAQNAKTLPNSKVVSSTIKELSKVEQAKMNTSRMILCKWRQLVKPKHITVLVHMLQEQTEMVNKMCNHSIDYAAAFNTLNKENYLLEHNKAARDTLGPLHIRLWLLVLLGMAAHFEQKGKSQDTTLDWQAKVDACNNYLASLEVKSWKEIQAELQVFRLMKTFKKDAIKLEIVYTPSTQMDTTGDFMMRIYFPYLQSLGCRMMLAVEPNAQ